MLDIIELIQNNYCDFSKGHKKIADYVLANYDKAVFMTAAELGNETLTSEATVVRFSTKLGFSGYSDFIKALSLWVSSSIEKRKDITHKVKISSIPDTFKAVIDKDMTNLKCTLDEIDIDSFNQAIEYIAQAKNIYIIGLRNCKPLADILSINLNLVRPGVNLISTSITSEIFEQMVHLNSDDLLISFGFPDYSVRTIKAMEFANVRSARIISITDNIYSPMTMYTSCILTAKCDMTENITSMTGAMSLINAISLAVINKCGESYNNTVNMLNEAIENMS